MAEASMDAVHSNVCHLPGITRICFSPDGSTIFTGGTDCLVRIHKASSPDSEPGFYDEHQKAVSSLACSSNNLITASVDNIVRHFSYPQNEFAGFLTRGSGVAIRWVSLDPQGSRVAVCGDDLLVKIIDVQDTSKISLLTDNPKSVRSAAWDPRGVYLATATCDGKVKIYDTSTSASAPALVRILEGLIGSSEVDSDRSCYVAWHPSGNYFAIPTRTNDIGIINREGWGKMAAFSQDGHKCVVSELAWSPNGRYLASAAGPQILVWNTESRQVMARYTDAEGAISGLQFSPTANLLAFTSLGGTFHRWTDPIPPSLPSPFASEAAQQKKLDLLLDDEFGEDVDLEDKGEDLFGDGEGDAEDNWIVDDDGEYGQDNGERTRGGRTEVVNVTKAQPAFVPGSTSMRNKKRYLAFNMIGSVDITDQDTHHVVNVEFHDKSARRGYHFQDTAKYSMASLGEQGIAYIAPAEGSSQSTVYYRPYDSWASSADWTVSLLPGENAILVAAGGPASSSSKEAMGSVVIGTSKGYVRFLSSSGIQRYVWRIGEEMVSMVASREAVVIVHRDGGTSLDGCQNLRYSLIDLETFEILQQGSLPLPKRTTLAWLGFSAEGAPAMYDSNGVLSVLDRSRRPGQARWVPYFDSDVKRAGRQETYWPVGLNSGHLSCIVLKGTEKEPWFPRPLIQEVTVALPLLNMENQQGKLEESVVRGNLHLALLQDTLAFPPSSLPIDPDLQYLIKEREVALDKELLQLVQGACKADNLSRALDITRLMINPATVEAAAKVAGFYHLPGLRERVVAVKGEKERDRRQAKSSSRRDQVAATPGGPSGQTKSYTDFAPRDKPARSFAGKPVNRDSTPVHPPDTGRSSSHIPETPGVGVEETPEPERSEDIDALSPPRSPRQQADDMFVVPAKRKPEDSLSNGPKNPFAKKAQGSNPFAKPAATRDLSAIKSTSFFDRVDTIESSGVKASKAKPKKAPNENKPNGKQATLMGMVKRPAAPPRPVHQDSMTSTETDGEAEDFEEAMQSDVGVPSGVLEESQVQETVLDEDESMEA